MKIRKVKDETVEICSQCHKGADAIRHLYKLDMGSAAVVVCSTCLSSLASDVLEVLEAEDTAMIPNIKETDYDKEVNPILRRLFNIKVSGAWTEEHEKIYEGLLPDRMCNSNRLLHREIGRW